MNSPHADHARERAELSQARHDATYGPNSQTPLARRNRALLRVGSVAVWVIVIGLLVLTLWLR